MKMLGCMLTQHDGAAPCEVLVQETWQLVQMLSEFHSLS